MRLRRFVERTTELDRAFVSGNPNGRPVGSRTAFSHRFLKDLVEVWQEHGRDTMLHTAKTQPATFFEAPNECAIYLLRSLLRQTSYWVKCLRKYRWFTGHQSRSSKLRTNARFICCVVYCGKLHVGLNAFENTGGLQDTSQKASSLCHFSPNAPTGLLAPALVCFEQVRERDGAGAGIGTENFGLGLVRQRRTFAHPINDLADES